MLLLPQPQRCTRRTEMVEKGVECAARSVAGSGKGGKGGLPWGRVETLLLLLLLL